MDELLNYIGGDHFTVVENYAELRPEDLENINEIAKRGGLVVQFAENGREVHIAGPY